MSTLARRHGFFLLGPWLFSVQSQNPCLHCGFRHFASMSQRMLWICFVGAGHIAPFEVSVSWVCIPEDILLLLTWDNICATIDCVYDFFSSYSDSQYLTHRVVLCSSNTVVDKINEAVYNRVPSCSNTFASCDTSLLYHGCLLCYYIKEYWSRQWRWSALSTGILALYCHQQFSTTRYWFESWCVWCF